MTFCPPLFPQVVVVGNPANTNAMICSRFAPSIPKENFTCLTRLDQNRAQAQVSRRGKRGRRGGRERSGGSKGKERIERKGRREGENGEREESVYLLTMFYMSTLRLLLA